MALIEDLAARTFAARDAAHRAHWKTASFSAHVALGALYEALPGVLDEIVETYQGTFGLLQPFEVHCGAVANVVQHLVDEADWVQANRDEIAQGSTAVQNLLDTLIGTYRHAIYKLKELQ